MTLSGTQGALDSYAEIDRRRGVGQYPVEEVIRDNPNVFVVVDAQMSVLKTVA